MSAGSCKQRAVGEASVRGVFPPLPVGSPKGPSTLLVLARLVLVARLVWLLPVLVNLRPHYVSCSPGFGA
jgi:hypothetical protein